MCDSEKSTSFFRPWSGDDDCSSPPPSAFSPVSESSRRSHSVSSDDTSSESSLQMLKHFVDEKEPLWSSNAATTCYSVPMAHNHHHMQGGFFDAEYAWLASSYQSVQDAVQRLNQQDAVAKQMKKLRPKKFKCEFCMVAFSNNGQLKGHLRIHTGERPFKCDADGCGKSFTRNEELTRHKRIHTGLRPYLCHVCRKGFGRKDHLKKHSKTHEARAQPGYQLSAAAAMAAVAAYAGYHHHPTALGYTLV